MNREFYFSNREFCKRMDADLSFFCWTLNERFRAFDEELPSFDECPEVPQNCHPTDHPQRLKRLSFNRREDSAIFVAGRPSLPI